MKQLTAGSLFSGIGGIDLAFALAGFNILFQVDIDDLCRKVLAKHGPTYWPDAEIHTDVCGVGRHNLPSVDVLFGGFPCQDISSAGRGEGIQIGTRSGLWFEFKRIIGELRPSYVLLENVAAITRKDGIKVIGSLAEMGYDARWGVISAQDAGAPHLRERWWCVGIDMEHASAQRQRQQHAGMVSGEARQLGGGLDTLDVGNPTSQRCERLKPKPFTQESEGSPNPYRFGEDGSQTIWPPDQSNVDRRTHGVSGRMDGYQLMAHKWPASMQPEQYPHEAPRMTAGDKHTRNRLRALGNAVVPQCVYPIALEIAEMLRPR